MKSESFFAQWWTCAMHIYQLLSLNCIDQNILKPFYIKLLISCFKIERSDLVMTSGSLRSCFPNFISFSCSRLTVTSFFFFILHSTQTSNFKIFTPEFRNIYPWISKYPEFWNIYPWIFKQLPLYFEIFTPVFRIITFVFRNI